MIKMLVTGFVFLSIISSLVWSEYSDYVRQEQREALRAEETLQALDHIVGLKDIYQADTTWLKRSGLQDHRELYSAQLESLWKEHDVILFVGTIADIESIDENNYKISIEEPLFSLTVFSTARLRLTLSANKELVDKFIGSQSDAISEAVAVFATVERVKSAKEECFDYENKCDYLDVKIGVGELVNLASLSGLTGESIFSL